MYNILICDDERDIVAALEIYLSAEGYGIYKAYTGMEALRILDEAPIHLVLMDIMMPGMDGISATVKLRERYNVPVISSRQRAKRTTKSSGSPSAGTTILRSRSPLSK